LGRSFPEVLIDEYSIWSGLNLQKRHLGVKEISGGEMEREHFQRPEETRHAVLPLIRDNPVF